jgi:hypothetical protein
MDLDFGSLFSSFLIGTIGFGIFLYGKKAGSALPLAIGAILMIYPYFISNTIAVWAVAALLIGILFVPRYLSGRA